MQSKAFNTNWNWVKLTGYENLDKMAFVELFDTILKPYHKVHKDTTFKSTSGSHEVQPAAAFSPAAFKSRLEVEALAERLKLKPSLRSATGVEELDEGGVIC